MQARMPELRKLLDEILPLKTWREIEARFVAFRRQHKFVPKKNVMFHLYKAQEVLRCHRHSPRHKHRNV